MRMREEHAEKTIPRQINYTLIAHFVRTCHSLAGFIKLKSACTLSCETIFKTLPMCSQPNTNLIALVFKAIAWKISLLISYIKSQQIDGITCDWKFPLNVLSIRKLSFDQTRYGLNGLMKKRVRHSFQFKRLYRQSVILIRNNVLRFSIMQMKRSPEFV